MQILFIAVNTLFPTMLANNHLGTIPHTYTPLLIYCYHLQSLTSLSTIFHMKPNKTKQ